MDQTLISEHILNGDHKQLSNTIFDIDITHILPDELHLIYQDIVNRVVLSNKFSFLNIYYLMNRIRSTQDNHLENHLRMSLINSMISHDIVNYQTTMSTLRKHSFFNVYYDVCELVVQNWCEHHINEFIYIRCLYKSTMPETFLREGVMILLRYGDVETMLDFVTYCGFDIHTLHLGKEIGLMEYDWYGFMEEFEDVSDEVIDKIYEYTKYHARIKFFTQFLLIQWAGNYHQFKDLDLIKELYVELDEGMRSIILSYALYGLNTAAVKIISQFGEIRLTHENLNAILEKMIYITNRDPEHKVTWATYTDTIIELTDFISKVSTLPSDSEYKYVPIVKIIKKLKS